MTTEVKVNIDAPKLADFSCYEDYKNNVELWNLTTDHPKKKRGVLLCQGIKNSHPDFGENIQKRLFQKHKPTELAERENGVDLILKFLDDEIGVTKRSAKLKFFKAAVTFKRTAGQSIQDYVKEFEYLLGRAEANGTKFDDDHKVYYIMENAGLSAQQYQLLNAVIDCADDKTLFKNVKTKMIDMLSNTFELSTPPSDNSLSEAFFTQHAEAFATWAKKKNFYKGKQNNNFQGSAAQGNNVQSSATQGNNYHSSATQKKTYNQGQSQTAYGNDMNPTDFKGRILACRICRSVKHLQADCPHKLKNQRPKLTFVIEGEEHNEDAAYDLIDLNDAIEDTEPTEKAIFFTTDKTELSKFTAETLNACALDTCCTSSVAGKNWINIYRQTLPKHLQHLLTGPHDSKTTFMFGNQETLPSQGLYQVPVIIANQLHVLPIDVIESDIPFLMSKNHMKKVGLALDLTNDTATANGQPIKINTTSAGHYTISLLGEDDTEDTLIMQHVLTTELENADHKQQFKMLSKIHAQFGHRPKKVYIDLLKSAGQWKDHFEDMIDKIINGCEGCILRKRNPDRPAVSLSLSNDFNQVVSMDLKLFKGKNILYMIDTFTRYTVATVIKSKEPEQVIKAFMEKWIRYFQKPRSIITDNGGEFTAHLTREVCSRLDISMLTTPAGSPWGNGVCEKNHYHNDSILGAVTTDNPKLDLEVAVAWSCAAKNSLTTVYGFSPYQLVFGRQPNLPNIIDEPPNALEEKSRSQSLEENLEAMHACRAAFIKSMNCAKLKQALRSKIRTSDYRYQQGDWVYYKREHSDTWLGPAKVVFQDGKLIGVRHGSYWCRVHANRIIPVKPELAEKLDQQYTNHETTEQPKQEQKAAAKNVDAPAILSSDIQIINNPVEPAAEQPPQANATPDHEQHDTTNHVNNDQPDTNSQNNIDEIPTASTDQNTRDTTAYTTQATIDTATNNHQPSVQQEKPQQNKPGRPRKTTQKPQNNILFKKNENVQIKLDGAWQNATVTGSMKRSGKYPNWYNFQLENGTQLNEDANNLEIRKVDEPRQDRENPEDNEVTNIAAEILAVLLSKEERSSDETMQAKLKELDKLKQFNTYEIIKDEGQEFITTTWVLTRKGEEIRARLTAKGFQEETEVPSDSPTMSKSSLRTILIIAASKGWEIESTDIQAAFLQGKPLERVVIVRPPREAYQAGILWRLIKCLYGLKDASKHWYDRVAEILDSLGFKPASDDPGLFYLTGPDGLEGIIGLHVDDFLHCGTHDFNQRVLPEVLKAFKIGRSEKTKFMYTGFQLVQESESITLDQESYVDKIKIPQLSAQRMSALTETMTEEELTLLRRMVGQINWTVRATRPDLSFDLINLSTKFQKGTLADLKDARKVLIKLKDVAKVKIPAIKNLHHAEIWLFSDASFGNLNEGVGSTQGQIIFLVDKDSGKCAPIEWKSNKIQRVVSSTLAAETLSMTSGLDAAIATRQLLRDLLGKAFKLPIRIIIDNKDCFESVHSTTTVTERRLRREISMVKQALKQKEVEQLIWITGEYQIADILTKKGVNPNNIKLVLQNGKFPEELFKVIKQKIN